MWFYYIVFINILIFPFVIYYIYKISKQKREFRNLDSVNYTQLDNATKLIDTPNFDLALEIDKATAIHKQYLSQYEPNRILNFKKANFMTIDRIKKYYQLNEGIISLSVTMGDGSVEEACSYHNLENYIKNTNKLHNTYNKIEIFTLSKEH